MSSSSEEYSSSEDGEGAPVTKKPRVCKYFGDKELSDVVLQVGNKDLHVHKMTLASQSSYFKRLFFSEESKDQKIFVLSDNSSDMHYILDAVYNNLSTTRFGRCPTHTILAIGGPDDESFKEAVVNVGSWWQLFDSIVTLSQKYEVATAVRIMVEHRFLSINCHDEDCVECTARVLLALHCKFHNVEDHLQVSHKCMALCLRILQHLTNVFVFNIQPSALTKLHNWDRRDTTVPKSSASSPEYKPAETTVVEFGDYNISDVTLVVGTYEFKIHKMCLASRSEYFRTIFFEFEESSKERVSIETDAGAFKCILDMIYNGVMQGAEFLTCKKENTLQQAWPRVAEFWELMPRIMKALDFFNFPAHLIEPTLAYYYCGKHACVECANKKFLVLMYNLNGLQQRVKSSTSAIASCLRNFPECLPDQLSFPPLALADLVEELGKRPENQRQQ